MFCAPHDPDSVSPQKPAASEPPALLDGLPVAAWLAAMEAARNEDEARAIVEKIYAEYEWFRLEAEARGVRLPRMYAPAKSILRRTRKKG
jgi:hypothetical protein